MTASTSMGQWHQWRQWRGKGFGGSFFFVLCACCSCLESVVFFAARVLAQRSGGVRLGNRGRRDDNDDRRKIKDDARASHVVVVRVILDFMCPWSFIGMRSLMLAREAFFDRLEFATFEFVPPGTYPPGRTEWTDYCEGRFLLEEKLPRALALGRAVGIEFCMDRRIVHTTDVNSALELAQRHGRLYHSISSMRWFPTGHRRCAIA